MKKNHFECTVNYKGHELFITGYYRHYISISQVFLSGTEIEISDKFYTGEYTELTELVKQELTKQEYKNIP